MEHSILVRIASLLKGRSRLELLAARGLILAMFYPPRRYTKSKLVRNWKILFYEYSNIHRLLPIVIGG
jgi:hypothetical protein